MRRSVAIASRSCRSFFRTGDTSDEREILWLILVVLDQRSRRRAVGCLTRLITLEQSWCVVDTVALSSLMPQHFVSPKLLNSVNEWSENLDSPFTQM